MKYVVVTLLGFVLFLGTSCFMQYQSIQQLTKELYEAQLSYSSCTARVRNILEDMQSDREFTDTPDLELPDVVDPDWLLPPARGSSE